MKLVKFENPIWATIQGEGTLMGTPSVFVRLFGCDYACEWCDTKGSWAPGFAGEEMSVADVLDAVREFRLRHLVVTGGNPVLQINDVADLLAGAREAWVEGHDAKGNAMWRPGMHTTVETQASVYEESIVTLTDLISLSPKLHDYRHDVVDLYIREAFLRPTKQVQVKIVCGSIDEAKAAIDEMVRLFKLFNRDDVSYEDRLHFILQPEGSRGRKGVEVVRLTLETWYRGQPPGQQVPIIRVIPQCHKTSLYVR